MSTRAVLVAERAIRLRPTVVWLSFPCRLIRGPPVARVHFDGKYNDNLTTTTITTNDHDDHDDLDDDDDDDDGQDTP